MRKQTITMPLLCVWLSVGFLLGSRAPRATAGSLTLTGNLNTVSNLTASTITLNSQTISNWPSGNLGGGAAVLSNAVLDFTQPAYFYQFTLTSNATWVFTNHVAGKTLWLQINQDTTGGWSNTWPVGLLGPGGAPINNTAVNPSAFSVFQILDTGSSWVTLTAGQNYMTPCTSNCSYALQFDGSQNDVSIGAFGGVTTQLTMEAWVNTSGGNSAASRVFQWNLPTAGSYQVLVVNDSYIGIDLGAAGNAYYSSGLTDGEWHHIAGTYDGSTVTFWLDGTSVATGSGSSDFTSLTSPAYLGCDQYREEVFKGTIDEVRLSNIVRYTNTFDSCNSLQFTNDANTVGLWHLDEGSGATTADSSGNGNTGTLQGSPLPAWVTGATCSDSDDDMLSGFGGSHFSSGMTGGSSMTSTSSSTGGSSMTITDTLGRIWSLVH